MSSDHRIFYLCYEIAEADIFWFFCFLCRLFVFDFCFLGLGFFCFFGLCLGGLVDFWCWKGFGIFYNFCCLLSWGRISVLFSWSDWFLLNFVFYYLIILIFSLSIFCIFNYLICFFSLAFCRFFLFFFWFFFLFILFSCILLRFLIFRL